MKKLKLRIYRFQQSNDSKYISYVMCTIMVAVQYIKNKKNFRHLPSYPIENVWRKIKSKMRYKNFKNIQGLEV